MLVFLLLLVLVVIGAVIAAAFFGGVSVGVSQHSEARNRLSNARLRALEAERRLHDLTRDTFIRMTEAAERRQQR